MTTGLAVIIYGSKNRPTKIENCCVFSVFRGISVLDVERADVSFTLPVFWSCEYSLCDTDKLLLLAAYFAFFKKEKKIMLCHGLDQECQSHFTLWATYGLL